MNIPIEEKFTGRIPAIAVLVLFYVIYLMKMLIQRRRGIKTRQNGGKKDKKTRSVEVFTNIATHSVVIAQLISIIFGWSLLPANARFTGFCTGLLGDIIFLISVVGMRNSWRIGIPDGDKTKLVTDGIYKFSRNPAFLGFDFMYIGIMLMYFNALTAVFTLSAVISLHLQILQEEKYLGKTFGTAYSEYRKKVFRYLGRK